MNQSESVKKVENNLRFIITIAVFFLSFLPDARLKGSVVIVIYIFCYIFLQTLSESYKKKELHWMNGTLLFTFAAYGIALSILVWSTQEPTITRWVLYSVIKVLQSSTLAIIFVPLLTFFIAIFPIFRKYFP